MLRNMQGKLFQHQLSKGQGINANEEHFLTCNIVDNCQTSERSWKLGRSIVKAEKEKNS